ncbi:aspartate aminotransferase family protein [Pseudaminobacter soli (ex Li et al. 2025)]|uniref:aspartate aminotransferase family protein n=1 Tax=Pseudaminobacter soli (ex Li et al. 2025) TaxID=1295366 RepID=UPI001AECCA25|nr:aspartate aminotransferase family protein [Mesorhizobium soli]
MNQQNPALAEIEARAAAMLSVEARIYTERRPKALASTQAGNGFFDGVPMHWMLDWPMPFPMIVDRASGVRLTDVDGNEVVDLCLGDTGAMFGHGPAPILRALEGVAHRGLTTMLPSADANVVASLLVERFGLPRWQIAATASDANRFAIRAARAVTGRRKILVFDGCYHGSVDETLVDLVDGKTLSRASLLGQAVDLGENTISIPFNDEEALRAALASGEVACVLAEPVMTNCGMILPEEGFHDVLRRLTREAGTLLLLDETHTISSGLGGYTAVHGLEPDILVMGKPIGGGIPVSIWGMTFDVAALLDKARKARETSGHSGIGTTLSGSALQLACLRASLEQIVTAETYARMGRQADVIDEGLRAAIADCGLPWTVTRVGARLEVVFTDTPVRNAVEARAAASSTIESALHLALLNRGFLVTPFHNMILVAPPLEEHEAQGLVRAYRDVLGELAATKAAA